MNELLLRRRTLLQSGLSTDPYLLQPFTITFDTATTFSIFTSDSGIASEDNPLSSLYIRINDGEWQQGVYLENWTAWVFNGKDEINVSVGDSLQIKAVGAWGTTGGDYFSICLGSSSARCVLSGNINSLVHGDNFVNATTMPDYALYNAFYDNSLYFSGCYTDISNLRLPATTVGKYAYYHLFYGSRITSAPELPATTLDERCYSGMFGSCTSLIQAPHLPATSLASYCYASMFYGCTSLEQAPTLPATTLVANCYRQMFRDCSKLTQAPILPATTLVSNCYYQLFYHCSNLNYIKAMFTTTPSTSYTSNWVNGVKSTGTFVKNSAASWNDTGNAGVPSGWTVQTSNS